MANTLQEFVIKLSAQVDNSGISQITSLLSSNKLQAMGVAAALTAATTAVYKFIESATKEELALRKTSLEKKKDVETIRAQQTALNAMNMTLKDIKKDSQLTEIYKDIKKTNEALGLPNMNAAIRNVNNLRGAFWKLKSAASYAIQWINKYVLHKLEGPMNRIAEKMNGITDWIKTNIEPLSERIGGYISSFAKGIIGIYDGVEKIVDLFVKLPSSVKGVAGAIAALWAIIKAGPIGQILAAITFIGELIDDYETYMEIMKANKGGAGYNVDDYVAYGGIWELLADDNMQNAEKFEGIASKIFGAITTAITNIPAADVGEAFGNIITKIFTDISDIISGAADGSESVLGGAADVIKNLGIKIYEMLASMFGNIDYKQVESSVSNIVSSIFRIIGEGFDLLVGGAMDLSGAMSESDQGQGHNMVLGLVNAIVEGLEAGMNELTPGDLAFGFQTMVETILHLISQGITMVFGTMNGQEGVEADEETKAGMLDYIGLLISDVLNYLTDAAVSIDFEKLGTDFGGLVSQILNGIIGFINKTLTNTSIVIGDVAELGKELFTGLVKMIAATIKNVKVDGKSLGQMIPGLIEVGGDLINGIFDIVVAGFQTFNATDENGKTIIGNLVDGLFGFIQDGINELFRRVTSTDPSEKLDLSEMFSGIGSKIGTALGEAIKGSADFLATFIDDCVKWVQNGGLQKIVALGVEIGKAILKGLFSIVDGLFSAVFGDGWESLKNDLLDRQAARQAINDLFPEENPDHVVTGESGREYTLGSALEAANTDEDATLVDLGIKSRTDFEKWQRAYLESFGLSELFQNTYGTLSGDTTKTREQEIAKIFGIDYVPGELSTITHGTEQKRFMPGADFTSLMGNISGATTAEEWNAAIEAMNEWLVSEGLMGGSIDTEKAQLAAQKALENSLDENSGSNEDVSSALDKSNSNMQILEEDVTSLIEAVEANTAAQSSGNSDPEKNAWGARIGHETITRVGEDGTEYIIPITKPQRAMSLLNQMFGEMGTSALRRIANDFGIGQAGTIGSSIASVANAAQGMIMNINNNISAPVTINVTSTSASAEDIGSSVYNTAERHLIRTLRGVYA